MELEIGNLDRDATVFDVQRVFAELLHSDQFFRPNLNDPEPLQRVPNFKVELVPRRAGGVGNEGRGKLFLPTRQLGDRLMRWVRERGTQNTVRILRRNIRLFVVEPHIPRRLELELQRAPYVSPDQAERRSQIYEELDHLLRVSRVQFGAWFLPDYHPETSRVFSVEYERDYTTHSTANLAVSYDQKAIRIEMGERMTEEQGYSIVIKFSSVNKMGIWFDDDAGYICFDMLIPPILEEKNFNGRPREGIERRKYRTRDRIHALDQKHAQVSPYAYQIRLALFNPDDVVFFEELCQIAGCEPVPTRVEAIDMTYNKAFFSPHKLSAVQRWLRSMDWKCAFQVEAILRSGLVNTEELLNGLLREIMDVHLKYGERTSEILRQYGEALRARERAAVEEPLACFKRVCSEILSEEQEYKPMALPSGHILCHHIICTPTRMILEGPIPTQSNRVVRRYQEHRADLVENFVRVEFRDEDLGPFRWDRNVDGSYFLQQRVGTILKDGFEIAGRMFEFLAYSMSALREHAVWFVHPFVDPKQGYVTAEDIRQSLGDFSGVVHQPSKYAARLSQAFTATDPSVKISRSQWEEVPDMGKDPYLHTDGVGTISPELGDMIWEVLCKGRRDKGENAVKPSAYMIRFLGFKGVVVLDEQLKGVKMRLRPSMRKFSVPGDNDADIEIARAFDYPNLTYLNRPLVMALEDRGVRKDTFMDLQEREKEKIYTASDSLDNFRTLLRDHSLGYKFNLPFILEQLAKLDLDLRPSHGKRVVGSAFFGRLLRYGQNHVLRDVKHRARIRVPNAWHLVGVADEGQSYIEAGHDPKTVFTLGEKEIYACVQERPDKEPMWLEGRCTIYRNPVVHPGDLQNVWAVGRPPADKLCFFRTLKNVVVLPAVGDRSLASCLGGGDVDGDAFNIFFNSPQLQPTLYVEPASYVGVGTRSLEDSRKSTVEDICDFIVEYIDSDVLSLLCDKHLVIADQSSDGTQDPKCMQLAELCSQAVDYPKNGIPVDLDGEEVPSKLIKFTPDWHKPEFGGPRDDDFYVSKRALGYLYRNITLKKPDEPLDVPLKPAKKSDPRADPIFQTVRKVVRRTLNNHLPVSPSPGPASLAEFLFTRYSRELRYIRVAHTLGESPDSRLDEEEVVLGTILTKCAHKILRSSRMQRMKVHTGVLVKDIQRRLLPDAADNDTERLTAGLKTAWEVLEWTYTKQGEEGAESFGLVVLGLILDCLTKLGAMPTGEPATPIPSTSTRATPPIKF